MDKRGLFIVIEGSDGSGKATQLNLLKERLKATGYTLAVFDFPRYDQESSYFVRQYLKGAYGQSGKISPYTASLFYALDRFAASKDIEQALKEGKIVLADRYVGSNMAHQGSKFDDPVEQRGFFVWEDNLEFQLLKIPRPDLSFFLRVPAGLSKKLLDERAAKTGVDLDGHERDNSHLKKALATYDVLCRLFPKDFKAIECTKNGQLLSIAEINNLIWDELKPLLPAEKPNAGHSTVVSLVTKTKPLSREPVSDEDLAFEFKDASLLLKLQLSHIKTSSMTTDEGSWSSSGYKFYTPQNLPRELAATYKAILQNTASLHEALRGAGKDKAKINDALTTITPLAALSRFSVKLKKTDINPVCSELLAQDTDEAQWAAKQLYLAARQKWPQDFKQALESKNGPESINKIIAKLANERLPSHNSSDEQIKLLESRPRQEFALLAESIYPFTNLSLEEIADEVSDWPYQQKYESLRQAAAIPGLLKKASYKIDVISDQITLSQITGAAGLKSVQVQALTPRYGYEMPAIIEESGLDDLYDECFDESLKLYSLLQSSDKTELAPYATLMGHKARWQLAADAQALAQAFKRQGSQSYKQVIEAVQEKVSEVHPLLWEIITQQPSTAPVGSKNGKARVKPSRQRSHKPKKS
ncbi:MAG: dTMP kinase [Candidatus Saccharimonadales bacterium]